MNNKIDITKKLKNAEGKRLLEKNALEYSKEIIVALEKNPEIITQILDDLEITEEEFFAYLSGEKKGNITLYDQTLCLVKEKILTKNNDSIYHKLNNKK